MTAMGPAPAEGTEIAARRRRAWLRSLGIASAAAFAGGVAVVGVQFTLSHVSASYPAAIHGLTCGVEQPGTTQMQTTTEDAATAVPVVRLVSGEPYVCRIEAPAADYAAWSIFGPASGTRSGPLDGSLPCQSAADFAAQDPAHLRLSPCQKGRAGAPGMYLLSVKVMVRGQPVVDSMTIAIHVVPADGSGQSAARHAVRVATSLQLPARTEEQTRSADLSARFSEHGLLPQRRSFTRTVYRLEPDEEFASAGFQARSASNASAVQLAYVPQSRSVTASFTLRSGPLIDRYQGWVSGTVAVRVRRQEAAREVPLPEAELRVPGRIEIPLPDGLDTSDARILLRRAATEEVAVSLAAGTPARFVGARVTARFTAEALVLEAAAE